MMSTQRNENESFQISIQYRILRMVLLVLVVILPAVVTVIPGVLRILYRADAQVALGHAKSVRLALQVTGQECYGRSGTFFDASKEGGVAESIWTEVLNLSKAPGDFWVLQMAEDGYTVEKFVYREGDYTVWYTLEPKSYTVYYEDYMAGKEE